jgi:homoserine dehydrogenase
MKLILVGFGVVGQGLADILRDKAAALQQNAGFSAQIVAVATRSRGAVAQPGGLDIDRLLAAIELGHLNQYPDAPGLRRDADILQMIRDTEADVMVEATHTNLQTGQPALDYCYAALDSGKHVVMANKGPIAIAYAELLERACKAKKLVRFEGTVMGGTPSIRLGMQALAGCQIFEARGILNGTTNYMLTQMEGGMSYAEALRQAQFLGYAEADPSADVDGWDAAIKASILSVVLFGRKLALSDMDVKGISNIRPEDIRAAQDAGERWKLIARISPEGGSVQPTRIPMSHPLAGVSGVTNALTYVTDLLGEVTLVGPGAGWLQTGFALLSDLLEIHRLRTGF